MQLARVQWILLISFSSCMWLLAFAVAFHSHRFRKHQNDLAIRKRYPLLVTLMNIFAILLLLQRPLAYAVRASPLYLTHPDTWLLVSRLQSISYSLLIGGVNCCFVARVWLIYYDLHYNFAMMNKQWMQQLDAASIERSFWLKYKRSLGSPKMVISTLFIVHSIYSVHNIVIRNVRLSDCTDVAAVQCSRQTFGRGKVEIISVSLWIGLNLAISLLFLCKWPKLWDYWHIRLELRFLTVSISCSFLLIALAKLIKFVALRRQNAVITYVSEMSVITITGAMYAICALISSWFILRKLNALQNERIQRERTGSKSRSIQDCPRVSVILKNEHDFILFMHHLCKEFASENLLCFVELLHFKYLLNETYPTQCQLRGSLTVHGDDIQEDYFDYVECNISENSVIPKSFIVHRMYSHLNANDKERWLRIAHSLYQKYIKAGVELQVNISGELRSHYTRLMDNWNRFWSAKQAIEEIELFELFDEVIEETYNMMLGSRDRFMSSKPSMTIKSLLIEQQIPKESRGGDEENEQKQSQVLEALCVFDETDHDTGNAMDTLRDIGRTDTGEYSE